VFKQFKGVEISLVYKLEAVNISGIFKFERNSKIYEVVQILRDSFNTAEGIICVHKNSGGSQIRTYLLDYIK